MPILGFRVVQSNIDSAEFDCPGCNSVEIGNLNQGYMYLTVLFYPLISLCQTGRSVQCTTCGRTFPEACYTYDAQKARRKVDDQLLRVMVLAALVDGGLDDEEKIRISLEYEELVGAAPTELTLQQEVQMAKVSNTKLNGYVGSILSELSSDDLVLVFKLVYRTMSARGPLNAEQLGELYRLGTTLGLSIDDYSARLAELRGESKN